MFVLLGSEHAYLAVIGVLSMDEFDAVLIPFVPLEGVSCMIGVDAFLGVDEPKPTGVGRVCCRPPDLMDEDLRMPEPPGLSSELSEMLDPVREGGREPPLEPGPPRPLWRR